MNWKKNILRKDGEIEKPLAHQVKMVSNNFSIQSSNTAEVSFALCPIEVNEIQYQSTTEVNVNEFFSPIKKKAIDLEPCNELASNSV